MSGVKVFPVPYAGASVNVYYAWKKIFPLGYEICLNELAGRGGRYDEPFYQSVNQAAEDLADRINKKMDTDDEYILFGHSMGALLVYEIYFEMKKRGIKPPKHIFFSGRRAPQITFEKCNVENMDENTFLKMVEELGGLPKEFYKEEIKSVFLPILKSDFFLIDNYLYQSKKNKIDCDVSVLYGTEDTSMLVEEALKWEELCDKKINFHKFDGSHFFINTCSEKIVGLIVNATRQ